MALGKQGRTDGKAYSLKLKLKDGAAFLDCAVFEVQEKQGDNYVVIDKVTDVSGDLFSLTVREGEHEGKPIRSFKVGLRDPEKNEAYFVDASLGSSVGRNLANSLLNLPALNAVEIGLYGQRSKTNGKTYPAVSVRQGTSEETVKWKYDPKDGVIPAVRLFKGRGGKDEKDFTDQEVFLLEKLTEFGETLKSRAPSQSTTEKPAPAAAAPATEAPKSAKPAPRRSPRPTVNPQPAAPASVGTTDAGDGDIPF